MHIEILVEDSSGETLLRVLLPRLLGPQGEPHSWRLHAYKGIGRIPQGLLTKADPAKRILLDQLPKLLRGYGRTPGVDAVVVVLDTDKRDCAAFLAELESAAAACSPAPNTLFRLAIEEIEAWYLGDRDALLAAYPRAVGAWCWHARHAAPCRVVDRQDMWGETAYRVWLPTKDAVVRARAQDLARSTAFSPRSSTSSTPQRRPSCWMRWRTTCCWRPSSPAWSRCRTSSMR
jgi:hypothetical protein